MNTTGDPQGAGPGDEQPGSYGYSGGYGYGPGYGDPDGGGSYSYGDTYGDPGADQGAGYPPAGQPSQQDYPGQPGPAAPQPPVVAATPALKGYPGGPGLGVATVDHGPAAVDGHGAHGLSTQSVWQNSQRAWRDSGVEWQRAAADWEPAEADWDRTQAPARRRIAVPRPAQTRPAQTRPAQASPRLPKTPKPPKAPNTPKTSSAPKTPNTPKALNTPKTTTSPSTPTTPSPAQQAAPASTFTPAKTSPFQVRKGVWQSAVLVVIVIAIVLIALFVFGGSGNGKTNNNTTVQYPAAALASQDFTVPGGGQQGRGIFQTVNGVAAAGGTLVAMAAESGQWLPRAEFLTSANGGHTWSLAQVQGSLPDPAALPTVLAGGAGGTGGTGGWLALGPGTAWTSKTGSTWTASSTTGLASLTSGDRLLGLAAYSGGFLAVGENVPPGKKPSDSTAVAWTSTNGTSWQRLDINLPGGHALRITQAVGSGANLVIEGVATVTHRVKHHKPTVTTGPAVWYSGNGGTSWTAAKIPVASGSSNSIAGLAASAGGFVVIRPGTSKSVGPDAVAYVSATGKSWAKAGTIFATRKQHLSVTQVGGSDQGVGVVGKTAAGGLIAFESGTGHGWHPVASPGGHADALAGITVADGGAVVGGGATARTTQAQAPYLVVASSQTQVINFSGIPGATGVAQTIGGLATGGSTQVAVGSANGYPAIWTSHANRWSPVSSPALTPAGLSALTGVAHGHQGWVAVGGTTVPSVRPLVMTSADADGTSWQSADGQSAFDGPGIIAYQAAAGQGGYVIVGKQDVPASTTKTTTGKGKHRKTVKHTVPAHTIAATWWSSDLAAWARGTDAGSGDLDGAGNRTLAAVTAGGPGYVAAGGIGTSPAVWTSADGQRWKATSLPLPAGAASALLSNVAAQGSKIVATGLEVSGIGAAPFAEYSLNGGSSWQDVPLTAHGTATSVTALTAAAGGFTAVGTVGAPGAQRVVVWWSRTGASWQADEPSGTGLDAPGSQAITALSAPSPSSAALTGAGYLAGPDAQQPTLWKATAG